MRLDRFLESALSCSARTVRHMLTERKIIVNGEAIANGRQHISKFCRIEAEGQTLQARDRIYLMLHKPKGCVSATSDTKNPTVLDLIGSPTDCTSKADLHLAGRLDFNTTGLLLLTNDGEWSQGLAHPDHKIPKTYRVKTQDEITPDYVKAFAEGVYFRYEDLTTQPAELHILDSHTALISIYEGRYHQIKRMFGRFQNKVLDLHRTSIGNIVLDQNLAAGEYRRLTPAEIASVTPPHINNPPRV